MCCLLLCVFWLWCVLEQFSSEYSKEAACCGTSVVRLYNQFNYFPLLGIVPFRLYSYTSKEVLTVKLI